MTPESSGSSRGRFSFEQHEDDHEEDQGSDHLEMTFNSQPIFLPVDRMGALRADDTHAEVGLDCVHASAKVATALIAARLNPTSEVILGVQYRTSTAIAVGHVMPCKFTATHPPKLANFVQARIELNVVLPQPRESIDPPDLEVV